MTASGKIARSIGIGVPHHYLTGRVVGVILTLSSRITLVSEPGRTLGRAHGTTLY